MSIDAPIAARARSGSREFWRRYCALRWCDSELGTSLDVSRVRFAEGHLARMDKAMTSAIDAMAALEAGIEANRDEGRMVGHYWLRAPRLAPTASIERAIRSTVNSLLMFGDAVRDGRIHGVAGPFKHVVHVGIGGSVLGAQFACDAVERDQRGLAIHFLDNGDPESIDRLVRVLGDDLGRTLVSVASKSGETPTPRYVLAELEAAYAARGLSVARHACATSMPGTELDRRASRERWLARFPLWEWVGGRTSVTSAVGLVPMALQGSDIAGFLEGAAAMDRLTRERNTRLNPAALLALMWHGLGDGRGSRDMVVLPYKDRLALASRYVQQLVMESVGKAHDRGGRTVHQGLTVYGNKGSTDQHTYMQQLRDGPTDFFVLFIQVHRDRDGLSVDVEPGVTLGDHLFGSLVGARAALWERGKDSITISIPDLSARSVGALIALFERAVGLYAELIDVNAYHQPGVDKHAAAPTVQLQKVITTWLAGTGIARTAEEIADAIGEPHRVDAVFELLERLSVVGGRGVTLTTPGAGPAEARFVAREDYRG